MKEESLEEYIKLEKIGEGTYGVVYKSRHIASGKIVALKKIRLNADSEGIPSTTLREVAILKEITHPNIVAFHGVIYGEENMIFMSFEYMNQDLKKFIDGRKTMLPRNLIKSYMHQLLSALCYCHRRNIVHRDLKPQNLLLDEYGHIKLADFGLARHFSVPLRNYTVEVITLWYRAPEILLGAPYYTPTVDIWSLGCIFSEMLTLKPLFPGDSEIDQIFRMCRTLGTPNEETWPGVNTYLNYATNFPKWTERSVEDFVCEVDTDTENILLKMITFDPNKRLTASKALGHHYFDDVVMVSPKLDI